jgi:hypothetical protein
MLAAQKPVLFSFWSHRFYIFLCVCATQANVLEYCRHGSELLQPLLTLCERSFDNTTLSLSSELLEKLVRTEKKP